MKTNLFNLIIALTVITFSMSSCTKEEMLEDNTSVKQANVTNIDLLTNNEWTLTSEINSVNGNIFDGMETKPECELDDVLIFTIDFKYIKNEGDMECVQDAAFVQDKGIWSFSEDETMLYWKGDEYTIIELSSTTLEISSTFNTRGLESTYTFTAQ